MGERVKREAAGADKGQGSAEPPTAEERAVKKKSFRAAALERRDSLTAKQRSDYSSRIVKRLTALSCYQDADAVLTYISFRSEADTLPLIEQAFADGKAVFAPKVTGKEMDFYRIFSHDDLAAGYRGILEPVGGQLFEAWKADQISQSVLVCMPGAAFDKERHRIGYGGGFYDRYLSKLLQDREDGEAQKYLPTAFCAVALAYDCQIFEKIPWESHDVCPVRIITETRIV